MRLLTENREIIANRIPIYSATGNLMHALICSTRRFTPPYLGRFIFTQRWTISSRFCLA
jgi:hypothetical protein